MDPACIVDCLANVNKALNDAGIGPGSISHTVAQLHAAFEDGVTTLKGRLEVSFPTEFGTRIVDVIVSGVHTEIKTGLDIRSALNIEQLKKDASLAASEGIQNAWKLTNIDFSQPANIQAVQQKMAEVRDQLLEAGFGPDKLRAALDSFQFVDKFGKAVKVELDSAGNLIFKDAMGNLFGPDGKVAQEAEKATGSSPNFSPAMQNLFGPSGKVAAAATNAAQGTNLDAASETLEKKIEDGVGGAMAKAGETVAAKGAKELGTKIAAGATALGSILTSVPALYASVKNLGDVWDKPLKSTSDYMNLFSALGGTITQGVQTIEALAGVTKIASAAQAVFNAIAAMNPYVLIAIAVIVLIAAIAALIIYWDKVKEVVRDNPWLPVLLVLLGPIGILIGLIILIAAHWEEVKLAVLVAANFISIQLQRIGAFFVGVYNLAGQVWGAIVATAVNAGIGIANAFISVGTEIQNFFIGVINKILELYNEVATSAIGEFVGLEPAKLIPEVDLKTRLIPPKEVPAINVAAAFDTGPITGGLEGAVAEQQAKVDAARKEDEARRAAAAAPPPPAGAAAPGAPALPGGLPAGLPAGVPAAPALPPGAALAPLPLPAAGGAAAAGGAVDASVTVNGGITVNINAEKLEADAGKLLSDDIIAQLQARLGSLRSEQDFRTGAR
jgi:hypothetical protein